MTSPLTHRPPLYKQDLDQQDCANPDCPGGHPIFMHAMCHPEARLNVGYTKALGCIEVFCGECGRLIVRIAVAEAVIQ